MVLVTFPPVVVPFAPVVVPFPPVVVPFPPAAFIRRWTYLACICLRGNKCHYHRRDVGYLFDEVAPRYHIVYTVLLFVLFLSVFVHFLPPSV